MIDVPQTCGWSMHRPLINNTSGGLIIAWIHKLTDSAPKAGIKLDYHGTKVGA